jgi:hypothetical protein
VLLPLVKERCIALLYYLKDKDALLKALAI